MIVDTAHFEASQTAHVRILQSIAELARTVRESGPGMGPWEHLTCREAEAVADVLRAGGHADAAEQLVDGHAAADDQDEMDIHRAKL